MGGTIARGIPSRDVAIALAVDVERYDYGVAFDDDPLVRNHVTVDMEARAYEDCPSFIHVCGSGRGLGVHRELRCITCRLSVPR